MLHGPASLLGANSLGGAINLITRRGGGAKAGDIELSAGSQGHRMVGGSTSGTGAFDLDYYVGGAYESERGWRDDTDGQVRRVFARAGRHTNRAGFGAQLLAGQSLARTAGSLPERLFVSNPSSNFTAGDFEDVRDGQASVHGYVSIAGGEGRFTGHVRRTVGERFNVNQEPDPAVRSRSHAFSAGLTTQWIRSFLANDWFGAGRLGIEAAVNRVRARIYATADDADSLTTDVASPGADLAAFALVDATCGRATFSVGARADHVAVPFHDRLRPDDTWNVFQQLSPRGGMRVALGRGGHVYASAGRSFRAPSIIELGCADPDAACPLPFALGDDPPLRPVRAVSYEIGGEWERGIVMLDVSAYRAHVRDEIFFVAAPNAPLAGHFTNLDRTVREGAEADASLSLVGGRIVPRLLMTWQRATFRDSVTLFSARAEDDFFGTPHAGRNVVSPGDRLPLVPRRTVGANVYVHLGTRRGLDLGVRTVGSQWLRGDEANETSELPSYSVWNARFTQGAGPWSATLAVTNAFGSRAASFGTFNEDRATGSLARFLNPLEARAFRLVASRVWGRVPDVAAPQ